MANPGHVKVVRKGAAAIAKWRRQNAGAMLDLAGADLRKASLVKADLSGAFLREADLRDADLSHGNLDDAMLLDANLAFAELTGANLRRAFLVGANLSGANLAESDLGEAELNPADLRGANLTDALLFGADLRGAVLVGARLRRANLASARLGWTLMSDCDLSHATGLSSVDHVGPSSIGVDTLIASLRGTGNRLTRDLKIFFVRAGVPKELLEELRGIVEKAKYHSCFIAYGQPDLLFARKLHDDLVARGVSCWIYDLGKTPGEPIWREITRKRRQAGKMVVVCSVKALVRDGMLKEIEEQIDEAPSKMVPISRDDIWTQPGFRVVRGSRDLKPFLLDKTYADFSDDSLYDDELRRLLSGLRHKRGRR